MSYPIELFSSVGSASLIKRIFKVVIRSSDYVHQGTKYIYTRWRLQIMITLVMIRSGGYTLSFTCIAFNHSDNNLGRRTWELCRGIKRLRPWMYLSEVGRFTTKVSEIAQVHIPHSSFSDLIFISEKRGRRCSWFLIGLCCITRPPRVGSHDLTYHKNVHTLWISLHTIMVFFFSQENTCNFTQLKRQFSNLEQ